MNVLVRMSSELDCTVNFQLNLLENNNKTDQLLRLFFSQCSRNRWHQNYGYMLLLKDEPDFLPE